MRKKSLQSSIPEEVLLRAYKAGGKNVNWYAGRTSNNETDYKEIRKRFLKRKYTAADLEFLPAGSAERAKAIVQVMRKEKRKQQIDKLLSIFKP